MRSKQIRANVQRLLGDEAGLGIGLATRVYESMHRIQRRICEESLCLEEKMTLRIRAGVELYPFPDDFIAEIKIIPASGSAFEKINMDKVDVLKRNETSSDGEATYYYKVGNQFGFLNSAGSVPSEDSDVTLYYYRFPDEDVFPSNTDDLEISSRWDTAVQLGVIADLRGEEKDIARFEAEMVRQKRNQFNVQITSYQITPTSDYDG